MKGRAQLGKTVTKIQRKQLLLLWIIKIRDKIMIHRVSWRTLISSSHGSHKYMLVGTTETGLKQCTYLCQSVWHSMDCDSEVVSVYVNGVHFNFLFKAMLMQHIVTLYLTLQYSDFLHCAAVYCLYPNLQSVWLNHLLTHWNDRIQVYVANWLWTQCVYYCYHHLKWTPSCGPINISLINCHVWEES